jgi:hypothetical protein
VATRESIPVVDPAEIVIGMAVTPLGKPEMETMTSALAAAPRVTLRLAEAPGTTVAGVGETVNVSTDASGLASFVVVGVSVPTSLGG